MYCGFSIGHYFRKNIRTLSSRVRLETVFSGGRYVYAGKMHSPLPLPSANFGGASHGGGVSCVETRVENDPRGGSHAPMRTDETALDDESPAGRVGAVRVVMAAVDTVMVMAVRRRHPVQFVAYGLDQRHGRVLRRQAGVRGDELGAERRPVERAGAQGPGHEHRLVRTGPGLARRRSSPTRARRRRLMVRVRAPAVRVDRRRRFGPARRTTAARSGRTPVVHTYTQWYNQRRGLGVQTTPSPTWPSLNAY